MSYRLTNRVRGTGLASTDRLVLFVLADAADKTGRCWPSIQTIMEWTGLSERAVQGATQRLAGANDGTGQLTREVRAGRGIIYTIHPRTTCTPTPAAGAGGEAVSEPVPTPAPNAPPQQMHPAPHDVHPTPAAGAGGEAVSEPVPTPAPNAPPQQMHPAPHDVHPTPAAGAPTPAVGAPKPPITIIEPPTEPRARSGATPELLDQVCAAAGWRPPSEAKRVSALSDLDGWMDGGFDVDEDILPGIALALAEKPSRTGSLRRFTTTIAGLHGDRMRTAQQVREKAAREDRGPAIRLDRTSEGDNVAEMRTRLRREIGARTYGNWIEPLCFELNCETMTIAAPSAFMLDWTQDHFQDRLEKEARHLLGPEARLIWRLGEAA